MDQNFAAAAIRISRASIVMGGYLSRSRFAMAPDEIKAARHALGMSVSEMADWLGYEGANARDSIRDMEQGRKPVSGPVARALRLAIALKNMIEADPDESEWREAVQQAETALS